MGIVLLVGFPIVLPYTVSLNCVNSKCICVCVYSDMFSVNEVYSNMLLFIVTSPRSEPSWRSLMELLGQWEDVIMLHAASTMGMTSPYCS